MHCLFQRSFLACCKIFTTSIAIIGTYSRVPNNSQDLIGVWVRNFYDNLNVNDPIIVYFLTALKSYKWGVLNKSQLNTTYSEKRFLNVTYYIMK